MIVSGASSIVQGSSAEFTLNPAELLSLISNSYYQEEGFWSKVVLSYTHANSNQYQTLSFDYSQLSDLSEEKKGRLNFSPSAKIGDWTLNNITIYDKDRGKFLITAREIPNLSTYTISVTVE